MITGTMNTAQIRKELHQYIDKGDERFLRLVHAIATNYESDEDHTSPGSPMTVESYKTRIRNAKERVKSGYYTTQEDLEKEMEQW
jgi:competence protein ComGC